MWGPARVLAHYFQMVSRTFEFSTHKIRQPLRVVSLRDHGGIIGLLRQHHESACELHCFAYFLSMIVMGPKPA